MEAVEILLASAACGRGLQRRDGSMPPDRNGPWQQRATPVRCTAHWLIQFIQAAKLTGSVSFQNAWNGCARYLLSDAARPTGGAYLCRLEKNTDPVNGLVGQAWVAEALIELTLHTGSNEFIGEAHRLVRLHRYNRAVHLWHQIDLSGKPVGISRTLNQQLMMAAIALKVARHLNDDELEDAVLDFYSNLPVLIDTTVAGIPNHRIKLPVKTAFHRPTFWRQLIDKQRDRLTLGYASFILYALALAKYWSPEAGVWRYQRLLALIDGLLKAIVAGFPFGLMESRDSFRWAYNVTGAEMSFAIEQFASLPSSLKEGERWWRAQIEHYWDADRQLMSGHALDPVVLAARAYEFTRLKAVTSAHCITGPRHGN